MFDFGYVYFHPPLLPGSELWGRMWSILEDMGIRHSVLIHSIGQGSIKNLGFETKRQAIYFKLRF